MVAILLETLGADGKHYEGMRQYHNSVRDGNQSTEEYSSRTSKPMAPNMSVEMRSV
jgi:hypothetical protein